jgi:pyruvate/2-oxoglutarate/acetoin dehydrogenase E1 component
LSPAAEQLEFRAAIRAALDEELARDERVVVFGEDVARAGGVFQVTPGLLERHGPDRVFDTPISELALIGSAFGSAVCGLRPVVEVMFADFLGLVMDGLANQASKYWYLSNEQGSVPLVVRSAVGGGGRFGAIHSQIPAPWFQALPGLKIVAPARPADAKALLKAAIRDDNPVLFLEHKRLYSTKGPAEDLRVEPLGRASVVRPGRDLSIVTAMCGVGDALAAAEELQGHGIEVEVIDLGCLRPWDVATVIGSVRKTSRVLVVEEGPETGGWAGEVLAGVAEHALEHLDDAWRLTTPNLPIPYSPPLEDAHLPNAERIERSVLGRLGAAASATSPGGAGDA